MADKRKMSEDELKSKLDGQNMSQPMNTGSHPIHAVAMNSYDLTDFAVNAVPM